VWAPKSTADPPWSAGPTAGALRLPAGVSNECHGWLGPARNPLKEPSQSNLRPNHSQVEVLSKAFSCQLPASKMPYLSSPDSCLLAVRSTLLCLPKTSLVTSVSREVRLERLAAFKQWLIVLDDGRNSESCVACPNSNLLAGDWWVCGKWVQQNSSLQDDNIEINSLSRHTIASKMVESTRPTQPSQLE
jgi:hypothetical protein